MKKKKHGSLFFIFFCVQVHELTADSSSQTRFTALPYSTDHDLSLTVFQAFHGVVKFDIQIFTKTRKKAEKKAAVSALPHSPVGNRCHTFQ